MNTEAYQQTDLTNELSPDVGKLLVVLEIDLRDVFGDKAFDFPRVTYEAEEVEEIDEWPSHRLDFSTKWLWLSSRSLALADERFGKTKDERVVRPAQCCLVVLDQLRNDPAVHRLVRRQAQKNYVRSRRLFPAPEGCAYSETQ